MAMSVDGFIASPNQSLDNPFGEGVEGRLHHWMFDEPDANEPYKLELVDGLSPGCSAR
jgi:hypothetical protein